jgi:hypothetical protein
VNRGDRAKLFAPFEALGGLKQALTEKELEHEAEIIRRAKGEKYEECVGDMEDCQPDGNAFPNSY